MSFHFWSAPAERSGDGLLGANSKTPWSANGKNPKRCRAVLAIVCQRKEQP
jgi:hypothetical protein